MSSSMGPQGDPPGRDPGMATEEEAPGGPFSSWPRLYVTLVVYGIVWILLLYAVTQALNIDMLATGAGS